MDSNVIGLRRDVDDMLSYCPTKTVPDRVAVVAACAESHQLWIAPQTVPSEQPMMIRRHCRQDVTMYLVVVFHMPTTLRSHGVWTWIYCLRVDYQ